jgi:hypothetical protein
MAERSEVVGASLGEPIVAALPKRLHGEDRERWCECWRAALSTGTPYEIEYRIPTADQPESWYELRNPLVPISTAAAVPGGNADTRVTAAREMIDRQLRQLTRLVEDLSDVSRIAHGNIELQRRAVDLAEAVRVAVDAARPLVSRRHHQLTLECPPPAGAGGCRSRAVGADIHQSADQRREVHQPRRPYFARDGPTRARGRRLHPR